MNLDEQIMLIEHYSKLRYSHSGFESVLASLRELKRLRARVAELENSLQRQWPKQSNAEGGWTLDYCWLCVVKQKAEALYQGEDDGISMEQVEAVLLAVQRMP